MTGLRAGRPEVFVTVGMGPWPFDRLLEAVRPLCTTADVFVQTGTSTVDLPCPSAPFIDGAEMTARLASADVVITHAGNTVRLVQRQGRVPIAVAREHARGEMGNDHQVEYLRDEQDAGRVIAVWDVADLPRAVATHATRAAELIRSRPVPAVADPEQVADRLDDLVDALSRRRRPLTGWSDPAETGPSSATGNPFDDHPLRRYAFAWDHVADLEGPHLDIGIGMGDFAVPLHDRGTREVHGVDVHAGYVAAVRRAHPELAVQHVGLRGPLPYDDARFGSVTLLDVLEHCADEAELLAEAVRVLQPGGILVVTVPRRHAFSYLDPDNAKYRWPRLHRRVYTARFGAAEYERRFADVSNGLRGDMAATRTEHTNYRTEDLLDLLRAAGVEVVEVAGANLFWRWFQVPSLVTSGRPKAALGRLIAWDGRRFRSPRHAANLFVVARRPR